MDNYTHINYKKNEIRQVAFEPLFVAPLDPSVGQTYFDTKLKTLRTWDGKTWISNADLPIATDKVLGAIKVGERLVITEDGVLSAVIQSDNNLTDALKDAILNIPNTISQHNTDITAHPYLINLITQETYDRQLADMDLQNNIDTETARAISAETYLQNNKEDKSNKVQILSNNSTSTQYPSAKAVQNALNLKVDSNPLIQASSEYRVVKYDEKGLVIDGRLLTNDDVSGGIDASKIGDGSVSNAEFKTLDGVKSNIQDQLDDLDDKKANKIDGKTDLKEVRDKLNSDIQNLSQAIGSKYFPESIVERIKNLSEVPTVMQADNQHYIVSYINIINPGSGYKLNESFSLGNGGTIPVAITGITPSGGISQLSWAYDPISTDIKGTNLTPVSYSGNGTDATFTVFTRYAKGTDVVEGEILYVPSDDPLVQFTRMQGYVASELASQNDLQIGGYISSADPSTLMSSISVGSKWYQSTITGKPDTNFPWQVRTWDGSNWSPDTEDYTPRFNDIWSNKNSTDPLESSGYYWFDEWIPYGFSFNPDTFVHTINNQTISGVKKFTSTIVGNIDTADKLKTPRTIELDGDITGSVSFDGSSNVIIDTTIEPLSIVNSMIADSTIQADKIGNTALTNASLDYAKNKYINGNSKSYLNWLNSYASKLNWLLDNKNKIFVQATQPTANNTGDLWIQTIS